MAKLIIFSAPSGSGKSTIINYLLEQNLNLAFSCSATSRPPRGTEQHGVEYFFLSPEEFRTRIANDEFLEYEEPMHNQALADNKTMRYPSYFATKTYAQYLALDIFVHFFLLISDKQRDKLPLLHYLIHLFHNSPQDYHKSLLRIHP